MLNVAGSTPVGRSKSPDFLELRFYAAYSITGKRIWCDFPGLQRGLNALEHSRPVVPLSALLAHPRRHPINQRHERVSPKTSLLKMSFPIHQRRSVTEKSWQSQGTGVNGKRVSCSSLRQHMHYHCATVVSGKRRLRNRGLFQTRQPWYVGCVDDPFADRSATP